MLSGATARRRARTAGTALACSLLCAIATRGALDANAVPAEALLGRPGAALRF